MCLNSDPQTFSLWSRLDPVFSQYRSLNKAVVGLSELMLESIHKQTKLLFAKFFFCGYFKKLTGQILEYGSLMHFNLCFQYIHHKYMYLGPLKVSPQNCFCFEFNPSLERRKIMNLTEFYCFLVVVILVPTNGCMPTGYKQ